eukprot:PhF_6_TR39707/c0_g1_i1/m.59052
MFLAFAGFPCLCLVLSLFQLLVLSSICVVDPSDLLSHFDNPNCTDLVVQKSLKFDETISLTHTMRITCVDDATVFLLCQPRHHCFSIKADVSILFDGCSFYGGGVAVDHRECNLTIKGCRMNGNNEIRLVEVITGGNIVINDTWITKGRTTDTESGGGCVLVRYSKFVMMNRVIAHYCDSVRDGGCVSITGNITIKQDMKDVTYDVYGGLVVLQDVDFRWGGCRLSRGGVLAITLATSVYLRNITLQHGQADTEGCLRLMYVGPGDIVVHDTTIFNCSSSPKTGVKSDNGCVTISQRGGVNTHIMGMKVSMCYSQHDIGGVEFSETVFLNARSIDIRHSFTEHCFGGLDVRNVSSGSLHDVTLHNCSSGVCSGSLDFRGVRNFVVDNVVIGESSAPLNALSFDNCTNFTLKNVIVHATSTSTCTSMERVSNFTVKNATIMCGHETAHTLSPIKYKKWKTPRAGISSQQRDGESTRMSEKDWQEVTTTMTSQVMSGEAHTKQPKRSSTLNTQEGLKETLKTSAGVLTIVCGNSGGTSSTYSFQQFMYVQGIIDRHTTYLPLPWFLHPTQLSLGPCAATSSHLGAIVGNLSIVLVCLMIHYFVLGLLKFKGDLVKARFPEGISRIGGHFRGVVQSCCITVLVYSGRDNDCDTRSSIVVVIRVATGIILCLLLLTQFYFRRYVLSVVQKSDFNSLTGEWTTKSPIVAQYGFMFKTLRPHYLWYGYITMTQELLVSHIGAIAYPEGGDSTSVRDWTLFMATILLVGKEGLEFAVTLFIRPFTPWYVNYVEGFMQSIQIISLSLAAMGYVDEPLILETIYSIIAFSVACGKAIRTVSRRYRERSVRPQKKETSNLAF